ncbi:MAG: DUF3303 domain-containing protein [Acidobacteriia bacterium]|nr:DUF3303 domain-containing protein [Terriglobia bacterium]
MTFHITYKLTPENRNTAQQRLKSTGGLPPAGVTMIARWHCAQGQKGFVLAESSDALAIAKWLQDWTDLLTFEVTPVINDEQIARVIG